MPDTTPSHGAALAAYALAARALPLLAAPVLRRRLKRGKEDPARWREKLGEPTASRPRGTLVWLHAVGLGEVLALRGLIAAMARQQPGLSFLVTSTARSSAQVMAANLPPDTQHQFLPLDAPQYIARFLDHWRPDLSIWSEQDLWPNAICASHARAIPLALVNARITAASFERRKRGRALYRAILSRMSLICAQETGTASRLSALGARDVRVTGSLKAAAPPLGHDVAALVALQAACAGRRVWLAASTHPGDETEAIAAQSTLIAADPARLLVLVPRDGHRAPEIAQALRARSLPFAQRSTGALPSARDAVYLADTYGELGLFYRLADTALIGGGFDAIGGHNPWEAAALNTAILFGPDTHNFAADYTRLTKASAALCTPPGSLAAALTDPRLPDMAAAAHGIWQQARGALDPLAGDLLALGKHAP
ncbi:3-deoxy-D-manno-octulosonic acid transferase [Thiosulfatihalobacter marinus]|uniref:3-deoxy-D-manno-octulosonic acid transferase n=1 Tax=Thiosulfatihalobacter marinus TaxID=2792481 RepID=UPI001E2C4887|nr:glycosyltransferase N-terminal domain-containing protein [Thiosulfatihalobacter marinus]